MREKLVYIGRIHKPKNFNMKFPQLNLLFLIALLTLASCDKERVAVSNAELMQDSSIGMRCCDNAVADMLEDPRFIDFYDEFTNGIFDPAFVLLDQFDSDELSHQLEAFNACIDSGQSFDYCVGQSELLTKLLDIINGYDLKALIDLQNEFDYLNDDEFYQVLTEAFIQFSQDSGRQLTCFMQFRVEMLEAIALASIAGLSSGGAGVITIFAGMFRAKLNYCNCLYANYGAQC
jgi:hypothetical protein